MLKYMKSKWSCLGQWASRDKGKKKGEEEILEICPVFKVVFINIYHQFLYQIACLSHCASKNWLSANVMKQRLASADF